MYKQKMCLYKLTGSAFTHIHLVLRLRMHGAIHPLPHTSLWCGA